MTDWDRRPDGPAFLTADELAGRTGATVERIHELTTHGVLTPDGAGPLRARRRPPGPGDPRVRVSRDHVDALVAAGQQGRVSFAYYDELHQPPGPVADRTYGDFRRSLGRLGERLPSLYAAFGLAEPEPTTRLETAEEAFLADLLDTMDGTSRPEIAARVVRLYGEATRRAAEGALGLYEDLLVELGQVVALAGMPPEEEYARVFRPWARMARTIPTMTSYLATQHLSRAIDAFSAEQTERILEEAGFVPERRAVYPGVAFIDLTGFTRLSEERGDQAAAAVSLQLGDLAREIAARHDGRVVKLLGDGVLLRLPDALAAVDATLELVGRLPGADLPSGHAGIHSGPLIEREGDVFGRSVNLAARVSDVAPAGEVYVTGRGRGRRRRLSPPARAGRAGEPPGHRRGRALPRRGRVSRRGVRSS